MKTGDLLLRCYAVKDDDQWIAFCIDLGLAAQGDTYEETKRKLHDMIHEYILDALDGEDKEYADQLLSRKAPLSQFVTYYFYKLMFKIGAFKNGAHKLFNQPVPLVPAN